MDGRVDGRAVDQKIIFFSQQVRENGPRKLQNFSNGAGKVAVNFDLTIRMESRAKALGLKPLGLPRLWGVPRTLRTYSANLRDCTSAKIGLAYFDKKVVLGETCAQISAFRGEEELHKSARSGARRRDETPARFFFRAPLGFWGHGVQRPQGPALLP